MFPHPKRDASLLSAYQKELQHEVVVLEEVLHEIFELLVLRVARGLPDPHDQPSYDGHVYSGVFLPRRLEVLPHDDVQLPVRCLDAPVIDLAFEKRQRIAVRQVSYVGHRLQACLFPFSAGLRGGCLVDDGNAFYGVEAAALILLIVAVLASIASFFLNQSYLPLISALIVSIAFGVVIYYSLPIFADKFNDLNFQNGEYSQVLLYSILSGIAVIFSILPRFDEKKQRNRKPLPFPAEVFDSINEIGYSYFLSLNLYFLFFPLPIERRSPFSILCRVSR